MDSFSDTTTPEFWRHIRSTKGSDGQRLKVRELQEAGRYRAAVSAALEVETKEFNEMETIDKSVRQEAREEAGLTLAQRSYIQSWVAIVISAVALIVSIVIVQKPN